MQITILRHGEPDLAGWNKIHSSKMTDWIKAYNSAGVKNKALPSVQETIQKLKHNFIVCSDLTRSIHSAKIIGYPFPDKIDSVFREAELPTLNIPIIKLTPYCWSMVFRIFWLTGISPRAEAIEPFKHRVSNATEELIKLARNYESILLIGHGIINRFLAKDLISKGWLGKEAPNIHRYWSYNYWEYTTFTKRKNII